VHDLVQFVEDDENGEQPFVTLGLLNGVFSLSGEWLIPGDFFAYDGNLSFSGNISFTGVFISSDIYASPNILVSGSFTCGGPIILEDASLKNHTLIANGSVITAPLIQVSGNFNLSSLGTSTFVGEFVNYEGWVYASQQNQIIINGNYTQTNGTLVVYDLSGADIAPINISGNASVSGALKYSILEKPTSETKYVVLAAKSIYGTFSEHAIFGDDINFKDSDFSLSYNDERVTITLSPQKTSNKPHGLEWWIWLIIAGGIAVHIVILILVLRWVRSRRRNYRPVI